MQEVKNSEFKSDSEKDGLYEVIPAQDMSFTPQPNQFMRYNNNNKMVIPIVVGALSIVTKGLIKGLEVLSIRGRVETIQTAALLRLARMLRRVLETCYLLNSGGKQSTNAAIKNSQRRKIKAILRLARNDRLWFIL